MKISKEQKELIREYVGLMSAKTEMELRKKEDSSFFEYSYPNVDGVISERLMELVHELGMDENEEELKAIKEARE